MSSLYDCVRDGNPHPVVSALVVSDGRVLMIQRGKGSYEGYWALPGGMIDRNEEPEDSVLRELYEEAGVKGNSPQLVTAYLIKASVGLPHSSIDIVYKVNVSEQLPRFKKNTEVKKVSYFPLSQLPKEIAFGHRRIINKFVKL